MMEISELLTLATGAALGYVGKVLQMYLIKPDFIKIGLGFPEGSFEKGPQMDIQNFSGHLIRLRDFGFIESNGARFSLPEKYAESGYTDTRIVYEKTDLNERENLPAHFDSHLETIGAFAYTTAQKFPRITFNYDTNFIKSTWVRLCIYWFFLRGRTNWGKCLSKCK